MCEPRDAFGERGLGHGRDRAREHDRAPHVRGGQVGGGCDGLRHHALERALAQLVRQQAREEVLLGRGRRAEQRAQRVLPARGAAFARDPFESVEPGSSVADSERRLGCRRHVAQRVDRRRAQAEPAARERAREPGDRGLALVRAELVQTLDEQRHLRRAAPGRGEGVGDFRELAQLHALQILIVTDLRRAAICDAPAGPLR